MHTLQETLGCDYMLQIDSITYPKIINWENDGNVQDFSMANEPIGKQFKREEGEGKKRLAQFSSTRVSLTQAGND